ncbi:DUF3824 domain-containing protein [bacterium]|nr:DUF3824 domain-containing protein [bacterium]
MYRPKKYVRLDPLLRTPRLADVRNLLAAASKSRSCTVEQPWRSENLKMPFSLTVRVELGGSGEPVWTLYEGDGSKSRVMWSTGFGDVELLYDVLTLSLPSDGPNIFDPNSRPSTFSSSGAAVGASSAATSSAESSHESSTGQRPASFYEATDFSSNAGFSLEPSPELSPQSSQDSSPSSYPAHLAGDDFYTAEPAFEKSGSANKTQTSEFMIEPTNVTISAGNSSTSTSASAASENPSTVGPLDSSITPAAAAQLANSGQVPAQAPAPGQASGQYTAVPGNAQNYPPNFQQPYPPSGQFTQTGEHIVPVGQPGYPPNMPANYPPQYPNVPGNVQNYPTNLPPNHPSNYPANYPQNYPGQYPGVPAGQPNYPPNYQYPNAFGQNYPPGYPPNYAVPPQQVPGESLSTASTVPLSYGPSGAAMPTDPYGNLGMLPHPDLIKKRPVVMLGTFLVEAGLVPSSTIDAALQVQALVSQGTLSAMKAAEAVRRAHQRGGYVEPENIQSTATNEAIVRVKPQLGQVLVMAGIITATQLKAGLRMQEAMHAGAMTMPEAVDSLHRELSLAGQPVPSAQAEKIDIEEIRKIVALLRQAGMLSDADIEAATKVDATGGANVVKVLLASSKLDQLTIDAATTCQRFIDGGHLRPDQAFMALHYCQRMRVTFEEAASELALDTKK